MTEDYVKVSNFICDENCPLHTKIDLQRRSKHVYEVVGE